MPDLLFVFAAVHADEHAVFGTHDFGPLGEECDCIVKVIVAKLGTQGAEPTGPVHNIFDPGICVIECSPQTKALHKLIAMSDAVGWHELSHVLFQCKSGEIK